jgi:hypothetical protein
MRIVGFEACLVAQNGRGQIIGKACAILMEGTGIHPAAPFQN